MFQQSATVGKRLSALVGRCVFLTAALLLLLPGTASARLFTVCNLTSCPIQGSTITFFDAASGLGGTIDPVLSAVGPVGNYVGASPDFVANDFFIFDLTITSGELDSLSVALVASVFVWGDPITTGYFADAGKQDPNGDVALWGGVEILNEPNTGFFTGQSAYSFNLDGVQPGSQGAPAGYVEDSSTNEPPVGGTGLNETTVRLFTIFSGPTALEEFTAVSFMLSPVGGGDFTVQGEIIPEPGTILLLGSGLVALGLSRRRAQRD